MKKFYQGERRQGAALVFVGEEGSNLKPLDPAKSLKIRNHSPTGFEWGYGGSGPAQLALAILLDISGDPGAACIAYQDFKAEVVSRMPRGSSWQLTAEEIFFWLEGRIDAKRYFEAKWDGARSELTEDQS